MQYNPLQPPDENPPFAGMENLELSKLPALDRLQQAEFSDQVIESFARRNTFPMRTEFHNPKVIEQFGELYDKRFVHCFDLELTCWDSLDPEARPQDEMEIIEIGIESIDLENPKSVPVRLSAFVRPTRNPVLSEFCKELTGIKQVDVDSADPIEVLLPSLLSTLPPQSEAVWAAWGSDLYEMQQEYSAKSGDSQMIVDPRQVNVSAYFRAEHGGKKRGLRKAMAFLGLQQETPAHRALPDAVSLARVFRHLELTPLDAFVSKSKSYRERIISAQTQRIQKFSHRYNLEPEKAERLLTLMHWDFKRAGEVVALLDHNR